MLMRHFKIYSGFVGTPHEASLPLLYRTLLIVFVIFQISCGTIYSQDPDGISIGFQSHYGFILAHSEKIKSVSNTNPYGFELTFSRLHTNYESWRVFRKYNASGIQLSYFDFQNRDVIGQSYLVSIFTEPVIVARNKFIFSVKAGGGLSYQTKLYDYFTDSLNRFFSTRISFPLYISLRARYKVSSRLLFTISGQYNHISNGAIRVPNLGINYPTAGMGLEYFFRPVPDITKPMEPKPNTRKTSQYLNIQALAGFKWIYGEFTTAAGVSARYTKQIRTFYAFGGGVELILDGGVRKVIEIEEEMQVDYKRFALLAGQDFILGKITFSQNLGFYLYSPYKAKNFFYEKYELLYSINSKLSFGMFVKSHAIDAELMGFALNYSIPIRKN
jgi:hypothetical protein